jgi:hypothetical protein
VLANKTLVRVALAMNALGAILLFYSFQATSSNIRLVTVQDQSVLGGIEKSALCVYGMSMMTVVKGGMWSIGGGPCPDWEHSKAAAVVNIENPAFVTLGFILTFLGFSIQFFSFPSAKTERDLRAEIKRLRLETKIKPSTHF